MILKLARTQLRSDRILILVAAAVSLLMWISDVARFDRYTSQAVTLVFCQVPFLMLFFLTEGRNLAEKRRRLLAQLPVTGTAIRVAWWLRFLAIVPVACGLGILGLASFPPEPALGWAGSARIGAMLVAGFIAFAALVRIFSSSLLMRSQARYLVWLLAVLAAVVVNGQLGRWYRGEGPFRIADAIQWDVLIPAACGVALALIVADVLLDRAADNRLN